MPTIADTLNQGWQLQQAGRLHEAEKLYQQVLTALSAPLLSLRLCVKKGGLGAAKGASNVDRPSFVPSLIAVGCCFGQRPRKASPRRRRHYRLAAQFAR